MWTPLVSSDFHGNRQSEGQIVLKFTCTGIAWNCGFCVLRGGAVHTVVRLIACCPVQLQVGWFSCRGKLTVVDRSFYGTGRDLTPSRFFPFVSAVIRRRVRTFSRTELVMIQFSDLSVGRGVRPRGACLCVTGGECNSFGKCTLRGDH